MKTRFTSVINGPESDASCIRVKDCDAKGSVIFQVTKLVPNSSAAGRFYALGRVFSGTLTADKCFVLEEDYVPPHAVEAPPPAEESSAPAEAAAEEAAGSESPGGG